MITKLIRNEFYLERKSSFNLLYISFFAISCLMFLLFSFPLSKIYDSTVFSGFFWIIISLSTIKLIENSFAREKDYNIYDLINYYQLNNFFILNTWAVNPHNINSVEFGKFNYIIFIILSKLI